MTVPSSPAIESLRDLQRSCALDKVRKRLGVTRASLGSLSERTIEADRCYILDRGYISYRLWNAINVAGSSYVCRSSDRTLATVRQANELTDADRAASVVSDEIVDLGWKSKYRTRPDHPVRLICVAVKPHESSRGWKGPHCDGVLRLVTNRLDLPAELIAEMYRLRWMIEMFFRTFRQLLGCKCLGSA